MKCRWRLLRFTENVWDLVTAPSESLPMRKNGVENRDMVYGSKQETTTFIAAGVFKSKSKRENIVTSLLFG